ncbi:hypothetical protein FNV43_RR05610 [Rhamnella rubrinervis]|uniref:C2H2-type domain-containing protein n=1 Tax=Rhamnella rubrinervis TaxID=2594499 RepID=A0A8K0HLP3_9ROSA|nr:hypothetical protein FNV43_RR05610 [Rhamnella rubrinervis]
MDFAPEEFVGSNDQTHMVAKGKRTKRQRTCSPNYATAAAAAVTTSSSSSACGAASASGGAVGGCAGADDYVSFSSPTTSSGGGEIYESTEEEEDMANCLILLAQGDHAPRPPATHANNKVGFFVYECKTCNRTFPSFQALGGHRASHKKPKSVMVDDKKASSVVQPTSTVYAVPAASMADEFEQVLVFNKTSSAAPSPPLRIGNSTTGKLFVQSNKTAKVHECSICGSEFTSGQALGGHMRRHRASAPNAQSFEVVSSSNTTTSMDDQMKQRNNVLALDLNLPAPEDDHHRESKFQFVASAKQALVFSAGPTLVDCHY